MNILFYHANAIQPTEGGISKITFVLGELFKQHGHLVHYVSSKPFVSDDCLDNQHYLDNGKELSSLVRVVKDFDINIIINQFNFQRDTVDLIYSCKEQCKGLKIISCYHNSILTPIYNIAYQRELQIKNKHMGFVFQILKKSFVNKAIVSYYIRKYRQDYLHVYDKSDNVVLLCEGQKEEFIKMTGVKDISKLQVIYNTYPTPVNDVVPIDKKQRVLWVGTFDYRVKRPDYLLKAWSIIEDEFPDWELYMLGDGPSLNYMKEYARRLALKNVTFTGRVHPEEYYKSASIHCITSTHECFPMVILEAKANACPSVVCNCFTSASLLIHNETDGLLTKPFSHIKLAESLHTLMINPQKLSVMQRNALKDVGRFCSSNIYDAWSKLFNEMINDAK